MTAHRPRHHGDAVEYAHGQCRDGFVAVVEALGHLHIPVTLERTFKLVAQGILVAFAQGNGVPEAEVCSQRLLHLFPGDIVLALVTHTVDNTREAYMAYLLRLQDSEVERIGAIAQGEATCLMVGSDNDECLLGMLLVELVGHADGLVEVHRLLQCSCSIVGMAGIINLATLDHEEEALLVTLVVEVVDSSGCDLSQREVALTGIKSIGQRVLHRIGFLDEQHLIFTVIQCLIFFITTYDGIPRFTGKVVEVRSRWIIRIVFLGKVTACKELKARSRQLSAYFVIVVTTLLMGIERCGSGVIDRNARSHTHLDTTIVGPFGNACHRSPTTVHAYGSIIGLVTGSQCRSASCRVGDIATARVGGGKAGIGKLGKAQRSDTQLALARTKVVLRSNHLIQPHAITDEIEHILGCLAYPYGAKAHQRNKE